MDVDVEQIKELVKLVEKHHLDELTVEENGLSVTIKGMDAAGPAVQIPMAQQVVVQAASDDIAVVETAEEEIEHASEADASLKTIVAPMVGVFYRTPSPDEPAYIEVGDHIEIGQTIGLIEAMKVFSEIPSEVAGEVVDIPMAGGKLVQQGDTLVVVKAKE